VGGREGGGWKQGGGGGGVWVRVGGGGEGEMVRGGGGGGCVQLKKSIETQNHTRYTIYQWGGVGGCLGKGAVVGGVFGFRSLPSPGCINAGGSIGWMGW